MSFLRLTGDALSFFPSPDQSNAKTSPAQQPPAASTEDAAPIVIETEIPHCCFYCAWCGSPLLLPHDSLGLPFGGPLIRRIEARSIGTVCGTCNHVGVYSLFHGCAGYNSRHRFVAARPHGKTVLLDWIRCDERTCASPLPFFLTLEDESAYTKIHDNATSWLWEGLMCTGGHEIQPPRWVSDAGLHRVPIDLTQVGTRRRQ
ncbi:MAG TPA: hypothetical protein VL967_16535 [Terracidiphilus sp.]|nr:hypothetical protein [Terracidiphilus sp.]